MKSKRFTVCVKLNVPGSSYFELGHYHAFDADGAIIEAKRMGHLKEFMIEPFAFDSKKFMFINGQKIKR
jgi:hypothetical protein